MWFICKKSVEIMLLICSAEVFWIWIDTGAFKYRCLWWDFTTVVFWSACYIILIIRYLHHLRISHSYLEDNYDWDCWKKVSSGYYLKEKLQNDDLCWSSQLWYERSIGEVNRIAFMLFCFMPPYCGLWKFLEKFVCCGFFHHCFHSLSRVIFFTGHQ